MCDYVSIGRQWGLVNQFDHLYLDYKGKKHYLVELREKEWNHTPNPFHVEGMRCYHEQENLKALIKELKRIGIKDTETRVRIVQEIKRIVQRRFSHAIRDTQKPSL